MVMRSTAGSPRAIGDAVRAWLDGLDDAQRRLATYPFESDERFVWAYTPEPARKGLALGAMRPVQRAAARAIVDAAASARGAEEIAAIIDLETVLGEIERAAGRPGWQRRDPARYWLAVFGEPGADEPWSWRIGGHHVAVQVTAAGGEVIAAAPSFLGANPAGAPDGTRTLPGEEDLARALLAALGPGERGRAVVATSAPADILTGNGRHAEVASVPVGVRHADLGGAARAALERLIRHYVDRARADVAEQTWARAVAPELGDVTFAWAGSDLPGRGHYYAVRGPQFVIEYDNTQDGANHVHAVWRELANDWGEDLLARHLAGDHPVGG
ncbi:MAG TPA: DUF3500 domain-containing protein [Candidatus Limnocylindrales bacterium]|nr:DUF3500 domain-containing protein [Candidatus Limnocylindrales bacterium]